MVVVLSHFSDDKLPINKSFKSEESYHFVRTFHLLMSPPQKMSTKYLRTCCLHGVAFSLFFFVPEAA